VRSNYSAASQLYRNALEQNKWQATTNQPTSQPTNQPTKRSTNQPTFQTIDGVDGAACTCALACKGEWVKEDRARRALASHQPRLELGLAIAIHTNGVGGGSRGGFNPLPSSALGDASAWHRSCKLGMVSFLPPFVPRMHGKLPHLVTLCFCSSTMHDQERTEA
jgi:hypothetical protein